MNRALGFLAFLGATISAPARAENAIAADITVLCDPGAAHAVSDVGTLWQRRTGISVHVIVAPTPLLLEQIAHRIRSDLVIVEGETNAAAAASNGSIKPGTRFGGWRNHLVLAGRAVGRNNGAQTSDLTSLIAQGPVAIVDAPVDTAGLETRQAFEATGLWDSVQKQATGVANTDDAAYLLETGKVKLAVIYATDAAADHGLTVAATLPDASYPPIAYWAAETSVVINPETSKFAAFLQQPEARQILRADGLEVTP
jgi:molybdate transport system substrate-binding protein